MPRIPSKVLVVGLSIGLALPGMADAAAGRIYGKVTTEDGEVLKGRIRWDNHETFWDDILDAVKYDKKSHGYGMFEGGGKKKIEIGPINVVWNDEDDEENAKRQEEREQLEEEQAQVEEEYEQLA